MKKSKFTEGKIVFAIKQSESGVQVSEICRKMGLVRQRFTIVKVSTGRCSVRH